MLSCAIDPWAVHTAKWLAVRVVGLNVDRINVAGFYLLGSRLQPLLTLKAGMQISDVISLLADADDFLFELLNVSEGPKVEQSRPLAEQLQTTLAQLTRLPPRLAKVGVVFSTGRRITESEASAIMTLLKAFEAAFCSEMPKKEIFYVTPKRAYATDVLLQSAAASFSEMDRKYLSALALENIQEAAKCLVFDRYTAVGFHTLRAVEDIARRYYELVTDRDAVRSTPKGPRYETLGAIAQELEDQVKSRKGRNIGLLGLIAPVLSQLCTLYRNPLSHPEIIALEEDPAVDAFTQGIGVIANMLRDARNGGAHFSARWSAYNNFRP
jgi:hypothetical protein